VGYRKDYRQRIRIGCDFLRRCHRGIHLGSKAMNDKPTAIELHNNRVQSIFDTLSTQIYFGYNVKAVLLECPDDFLSKLEGIYRVV